MVAVQELHLNVKYNPLYWACACLCVNAGSNADNLLDYDDMGDEEQEVFEELSDGEQQRRTAVANYKKIGRAIADIQQSNIKISPPDINKASTDFTPDIKTNSIIYGLLGVKDVNEALIEQIMAKRPFTSSLDFYERVEPTNVQMLSLIKAGAFDSIENKSRVAILTQYLRHTAQEKIKLKTALNAVQLQKAIQMKIVPNSLQNCIRLYNFHKWIDTNQQVKVGKFYQYEFTDEDVIRYFTQNLKHLFDPKEDYYELNGKIVVQKKKMNKVYNDLIQPLVDWQNSDEACKNFYEAEINEYIEEQKEKYCQGSTKKWEFDALTCYMDEHEFARINNSLYNIVDFNSLPEQLKPAGTRIAKNGKEYEYYNIVRIVGTVVGADNNKHIVTLSTPTGIVDIKLYKEEYIYYNKNISDIDRKDGRKDKKIQIEKSWFERGRRLLVSGVRRENMFIPKKDWNQGHTNAIQLITNINGQNLELKTQREKVNELR